MTDLVGSVFSNQHVDELLTFLVNERLTLQNRHNVVHTMVTPKREILTLIIPLDQNQEKRRRT
jgi:hypothetical protein